MFTNAFGNAGAERRIGISAAYAPKETLNLAVGLFGDNESISRSTGAPVTDTPDESWGVNGRATWEPVFDTGKIVHLGVSGYYRTALKTGDTEDAVRLTDRPNIRVDNGNIADSGVITGVNRCSTPAPRRLACSGRSPSPAKYGRLWLDRPDAAERQLHRLLRLRGLYAHRRDAAVQGRQFRPRPAVQAKLGKDGLGAFELALRYDGSTCRTRRSSRQAMKRSSVTLGLNWYFNPYAKLMFNWVRFSGDNTPLDPVGSETEGDAFATRLHLDF